MFETHDKAVWPLCSACLGGRVRLKVRQQRYGKRTMELLEALTPWPLELLAKMEVRTLLIEPGNPWENSYIESFNGKLPERCSTARSSRRCWKSRC